MIRIEPNSLEEMINDARNTYPDECCGFLFGKEQDGKRFINQIKPVDNAREGDKRKRFEISSRDYMSAENYAEEKGIQLLGIYHSHPDHPAIPSETDRLSAQPFFSYIIISIGNQNLNGVRSWLLNNDFQFEEELIINEPILH
jgi:proteasome lid subunit RPN8/RPN11